MTEVKVRGMQEDGIYIPSLHDATSTHLMLGEGNALQMPDLPDLRQSCLRVDT